MKTASEKSTPEYKKKWLKEYREKNAERIRNNQKAWRVANPDKARESTYKWREKNRERFDANLAKYRKEHQAELSAYRQRQRLLHPEREKKVRAAWVAKNKGRLNADSNLRRIRTKGAHVENKALIKSFYVAVKSRKTNTCYYCRTRFTGMAEIDHILPLAKGGQHKIENLCVSCQKCNRSKKDKLVSAWKRDGQQVLSL